MNPPEAPTRTAATESRYLERGTRLLDIYREECASDQRTVAEWLQDRATGLSRASLRQYRSALAFTLESDGRTREANAVREVKAPESRACDEHAPTVLSTSSKKLKHVAQEFETALESSLRHHMKSSHWAARTLVWFKATLATGLRPSEWEHAVLLGEYDAFSGDGPVLRVTNAKNTNGRAHGDHRHLLLTDLAEDDLNFVMLQLVFTDPAETVGLIDGEDNKLGFNDYYNNVRTCMYRYAGKLRRSGQKTISLYSCRHQFIADLKVAGYSLTEIAALVGHGTDLTASETYGRRRYGKGGKGLPKPSPEEVARIKPVAKLKWDIKKPGPGPSASTS